MSRSRGAMLRIAGRPGHLVVDSSAVSADCGPRSRPHLKSLRYRVDHTDAKRRWPPAFMSPTLEPAPEICTGR